LVVEDEEVVRLMTARALREAGYRVIDAHDGVAALEVLDGEGPVQLVLTDVVMPRMDGHQLAVHLEARSQTPAVLFMSGYGPEHLEDLPGPILNKPFSPATLQATVQLLLTKDTA